MKTSELIGEPLNWAVAKALGSVPKDWKAIYSNWEARNYSTDWAQGGPIIDRENIGIVCQQPGSVQRCVYRQTDAGEVFYYYGPNLLIAAMRAFVASKLGDTIDIPKELT